MDNAGDLPVSMLLALDVVNWNVCAPKVRLLTGTSVKNVVLPGNTYIVEGVNTPSTYSLIAVRSVPSATTHEITGFKLVVVGACRLVGVASVVIGVVIVKCTGVLLVLSGPTPILVV